MAQLPHTAVRRISSIGRALVASALVAVLAGCATMPDWMSADGPSRQQVQERREGSIEGITLIDVTDALTKTLATKKRMGDFAVQFPNSGSSNYLIGPGDILEVSVWETPPAMLFGTIALDAKATSAASNAFILPHQMVSPDGMISMPFAGRIPAKGRDTQKIEESIAKRLQGKANNPQVMVRVIQNNTSNVTVVGEVNQSLLMPLTPRGERLLDAVAAGGGVKQAVNRIAIQLSREQNTATMALDTIIRSPQQNIMLKPGDVVTALYQNQSFSILGATGKNEEVPFEAQGISLVQALARSGGLDTSRADARGVFIFRFEDAALVDGAPKSALVDKRGVVPVVYQVNLRDPGAFFVTQNFPVQDKDVIYVSNSPAAEFQKFLRLVVSVAVPSVTLNNTLSNF